MPLAQAQPPAPEPAPPKPAQRDSREDFIPGDPLGSRFGGGSITDAAAQTERITVLARSGVEPGLTLDERNRSKRIELIAVLCVIAALAAGAIWFYWTRGHVNFAGHGHNRE